MTSPEKKENVTQLRPEVVHETHDAPIGQLLKDLMSDSKSLLKTEVDLFKSEFSDKLTLSQRGMKSMAAGGAVLFFAGQAAVATIIIALSYAIDPWLAALLVTIALAAVGIGLVVSGKKALTAEKLKPQASIDTLKDEGNFVKEKWNDKRKHG